MGRPRDDSMIQRILAWLREPYLCYMKQNQNKEKGVNKK